MEYHETKDGFIEYICPVCGYKEKTKEQSKPKVEGIRIKAERIGEGVIIEKKRRIEISEEEIESALEILEGSEG